MKEYSAQNTFIKEHLQTHFITEEAYDAILENNLQKFLELRGKEIVAEIQSKTQFETFNEDEYVSQEEEIVEEDFEFETEIETEE